MMKESEDGLVKMTKFRVKIQESGGTKLANMFSTDLAAGEPCGREDCRPCATVTDRRQDCKKQSILYESSCKLCNPSSSTKSSPQDERRQGIYYGETSRSLYERSREHFKDAEDFGAGSHMVKHWMSSHSDENSCPPFQFKIIGSYRDCLSRQVSEALKIQNTGDEILNSKNEYASNCLARIVVDMDKFERKKMDRKEEEEEKLVARRLEIFKQDKKRPKRARSSPQEDIGQTTSSSKRPRLEISQPAEDEMDLGLWLLLGEARCLRVGNLRRRLEIDRDRIVKIMDSWQATNAMEHGPEGVGARYPINQPNSRSCLEGGVPSMVDQGLTTDRMNETIEVDHGLATNDGHVASPNHLPDLGARHPSKTSTTRSGLGGEIHHGLATTKRAGPTRYLK
jgi:hypothetical protein